MQRSGEPEERKIAISSTVTITSVKRMKALGIIIDPKLKWDCHVKELRKKITGIINGLRIIRRKLSFKQAITVVTSQALSILYYASSAWLTPSIGRKEMSSLESIHFKALRVVVKDYRQRISRSLISEKTNRLPPKLWCKFSCAMTLMKIWNNNAPTSLRQSAFANTYLKDRYPGLIYGFDASKTRIGKQVTRNWCGSVLSEIKVPWTNSQLSKDRLRVLLKSTFYPYNYVPFNF